MALSAETRQEIDVNQLLADANAQISAATKTLEEAKKSIAKSFSEEFYFGSVTGYDKTNKLWSIQYDDGDFEEMDGRT